MFHQKFENNSSNVGSASIQGERDEIRMINQYGRGMAIDELLKAMDATCLE